MAKVVKILGSKKDIGMYAYVDDGKVIPYWYDFFSEELVQEGIKDIVDTVACGEYLDRFLFSDPDEISRFEALDDLEILYRAE